MAKDQILGIVIFIASILAIFLYLWLFLVGLWWWALVVPMFVAVVGILAIMAWIGWTIARTPPPKPVEGLEFPESEKPPEGESEEGR